MNGGNTSLKTMGSMQPFSCWTQVKNLQFSDTPYIFCMIQISNQPSIVSPTWIRAGNNSVSQPVQKGVINYVPWAGQWYICTRGEKPLLWKSSKSYRRRSAEAARRSGSCARLQMKVKHKRRKSRGELISTYPIWYWPFSDQWKDIRQKNVKQVDCKTY